MNNTKTTINSLVTDMQKVCNNIELLYQYMTIEYNNDRTLELTYIEAAQNATKIYLSIQGLQQRTEFLDTIMKKA